VGLVVEVVLLLVGFPEKVEQLLKVLQVELVMDIMVEVETDFTVHMEQVEVVVLEVLV
jgi:hypothetical protein